MRFVPETISDAALCGVAFFVGLIVCERRARAARISR